MESAILLCVPDAEPLVHGWREKGDPSAAHGVPAHVTLLYPFLPLERIDAGVLGELEWFFSGIDAFPLRFGRVGRFEHAGIVFLAPESDTLVELTRAITRRWPECPPYAGQIPAGEVVPHLTIVHSEDRGLRQSAGNAVSARLPLRTTAVQAALWVCDDDGDWTELATFPFGPPE